MLKRALLVALSAAALLPLGGTAHASCLDNLRNGLDDGYTGDGPKSQYWDSGYVQQSGPATVAVYGDALVSDYVSYADDWARFAGVVGGNADNVTTGFVDCVAG